MSVNPLYGLDQIQPAHRSLVGDKALYLALLKQQGCPVIPGWVVSAEAFREFLENIDWQIPMFADLPNSSLHVDVDQPQQLQMVAQQIRQAILSSPVPEAWLLAIETAIAPWQSPALIFRPSFSLKGLDATVSHRTSGLLESHLSGTGQDAIAHSLKQTWAELFRARSLLYWQRLGIQIQKVRLAVLIQPIGAAIASGDMQVEDDGALEIRATWGLGEALIRGEVSPDRHRISATGIQTHTLGSKLYAYAISSTALAFPSLTSTVRYERLATDVVHRTQLTLSAEELQHLRELAQQATVQLKTALSLEWVICQLPEQTLPEQTLPEQSQAKIYITQVVPQLTAAVNRPEELAIPQPEKRENPLFPWINPTIHRQPVHLPTPELPDLNCLRGVPVSGGIVSAPAWVYQIGRSDIEIPLGVILVAPMIHPDQVAELRRAVGIVTEQGGTTSHGAILARELGIPAVVGVAGATQRIQTGDRIWVNGDRGEVRWQGEPQTEPLPVSPQRDRVPIATQLFVTLSQPEAIAQAVTLPVEGVGLLRSELLLSPVLGHRSENLSQQMVDRIQPFAAAFSPRPVFYRSLDLRSHEFSGITQTSEVNPVLGIRGTFSYQLNPSLFDQELAALRQVQQNGYTNVHLILPFVRTVEEFSFCRQRVEQAGLTQNPDFRLWIMAEVPSVLLLLPDYVQAGVQGIAIGSNDLTQLILGIDRDHPQMQPAFDQHHPAVMRAMQHLIQTSRQLGIPCSLCGQMPRQHLEAIESLIRWGITAISVDASDVAQVYRAIERAERPS
jgi:pyruvate, water dikinase